MAVSEPYSGQSSGSTIPVAGIPPACCANDRVHVVIQRESGWRLVDLAELWRYRDLIWLLARRDLKTRYRQSLLGAVWSVAQPLFTLLVFVAFFSLLGRVPTESGMSYVASLLCGIVLWAFFGSVMTSAGNSLPANVALIHKIYCPRLAFPLASLVTGFVDFLVAFAILILVLFRFGIVPGRALVLLPVFVALTGLTGVAAGLWLAALSVRWRDVRFAIPVILQTGFFASPVVYETAALIPKKWWWLYCLNPMATLIEGFRWSLGAKPVLGWTAYASCLLVSLLLLSSGLYLFRRVERTLPDYL